VARVAGRTLYRELAHRMGHQVRIGSFGIEKLPSQRDLCEIYGVSLPTVQKALGVLRKEGLISTRSRSGNYITPNAVAEQSERMGIRCVTVCFRRGMEDAAAGYWTSQSEYLLGYNRAAYASKIPLRIQSLPMGAEAHLALLAKDFSPEEQGFVLVNWEYQPTMAWLSEIGAAYVLQTYVRPRRPERMPPHHGCWVDKADATARAVDFLAELGHRRIGYVGRGYTEMPDGWLFEQAPYEGFVEGMRRNGFRVIPEITYQNEGSPATSLPPAVRALMAVPQLPTAIVCSDDWEAMHCIRLARGRGVAVPRELSVIGLDDQPGAAVCDPPLTTMAIPHARHAEDAFRLLLDAAEGRCQEFQTRVHKCTLVVRKSTAPPRESSDCPEGPAP